MAGRVVIDLLDDDDDDDREDDGDDGEVIVLPSSITATASPPNPREHWRASIERIDSSSHSSCI